MVNGGESPRKEVVTALDNVDGYSGIISENWKLVNGTTMNGIYDYHLGKIQEFSMSPESYSKLVLSSTVGKALQDNNLMAKSFNLTSKRIQSLRKKSTISCDELNNPLTKCDPLKSPCLFNIIADPCERKNVAELFPDILKKLSRRLKEIVKNSAVARRIRISDPECDPAKHNGVWGWWGDDKEY